MQSYSIQIHSRFISKAANLYLSLCFSPAWQLPSTAQQGFPVSKTMQQMEA